MIDTRLEQIKTELTSGLLTNEFKHLKFDKVNNEYIATLIDESGYAILKGYGTSVIDAINDLHSNLI